MNEGSIPVILDTDIGSDIDDSVCLAYLLCQPRCELVGITTVSGRDPRDRAALASAVCRAAGRDDVPIHSGAASRIMDGEIMQPNVPQAVVLDRFDHRGASDFAPNTAVRFLQETINARPGEITLLAIGAMTNLGLLFSLDPGTAHKLKRLVLMCGYFYLGGRPWRSHPFREPNALSDPLATHIVYRSSVADHLSVGADVTTLIQMQTPECVTRFKSARGPMKVVSAMTEVWNHTCATVTFHDPLAASLIFNPEICTYQQGQIAVELASPRIPGLTYFDRNDSNRPHRVACEVNSQAFFKEYFGITVKTTSRPIGYIPDFSSG